MTTPVILTGLRANNDLTLGNYFGAILPMIDMAKNRSKEYQINMFIPDLHSFTTPINHSTLYNQILQNANVFTAAGLPIDNDSIHLYRQSYVSAHSELTWILDNFTNMGQMSRMTQFKDKSASSREVSVGLFNYPVLMAADILLYGASYIPVGEDQTQHLEFARDIAERMNTRFGELFVIPEPVDKQHEFFGQDQGLRIKDLVNPTKKMSKSDELGKGVIFMSDDPAIAAKKIMSATTDDKASVTYDPGVQPGISNLLQISHLLHAMKYDVSLAEHASGMQREFEGRYGGFKKHVANQVKEFLESFQDNLRNVDHAAVVAKLDSSEAVMNIQANQRLLKVQQAIGLRPR